MTSESNATGPEQCDGWFRFRAALACAVAAVAILASAAVVWPEAVSDIPTRLIGLGEAVFERLSAGPPILFFATMAVACLFPIPISGFYISGATLFGPTTTLLWTLPTITLTILMSHFAAQSLVRPQVLRWIEARGHSLPEWSSNRDQTLVILLIRVTPGLPFFAQNLMLGLAKVDPTRSLLISVPVQMLFAVGYVLLGHSAFEGRIGIAITAIGALVVASVGARFAHRALSNEAGPSA